MAIRSLAADIRQPASQPNATGFPIFNSARVRFLLVFFSRGEEKEENGFDRVLRRKKRRRSESFEITDFLRDWGERERGEK